MNHDKLLLVVLAAALEFFSLPLCVLICTCVSCCSQRSNFLSSGSAVTKKLLVLLVVAAMLKSAFKPSPGNFPGSVSEYPRCFHTPLDFRPPLPEPVAVTGHTSAFVHSLALLHRVLLSPTSRTSSGVNARPTIPPCCRWSVVIQ